MNPSKAQTEFWIALNRAQRATHRTMEEALKAEGLPSLRWYDVLWDLERTKVGLQPFELEKSLLFEQSNLSHMLRRMIAEGLVEQKAHRHDGRARVVTITNKGRKVRKRMWAIYGPLIHEEMNKIPEQCDVESLAIALHSLID